MSIDEQIHLLDKLHGLLEKQIELARQGNINKVEILSRQAGFLVGKIAQTGVLELPEFKNQQGQLQKLYEDLCLAVTAQKAGTVEQLCRVRKGKKTIEVYRSNI